MPLPVVGLPKILPANAPAPAPINVLAIGLFSTLVKLLPPDLVGVLAVGVVVLLVIGLTGVFVVVLVIGLVAGVVVFVLVIGLVAAGVFVVVEPVDFTAGDAGRMVVAVFAATGALVLVVIGATGRAPAGAVVLVIGATGREVSRRGGAKVDSTA